VPIGDDSYPYTFTFSDSGAVVGVALNGTFAREVLGCEGDRDVVQKCIEDWRQELVEEALHRRTSWISMQSDVAPRAPVDFVCAIGLSGVPEYDSRRDFSRIRAVVNAKRGHE